MFRFTIGLRSSTSPPRHPAALDSSKDRLTVRDLRRDDKATIPSRSYQRLTNSFRQSFTPSRLRTRALLVSRCERTLERTQSNTETAPSPDLLTATVRSVNIILYTERLAAGPALSCCSCPRLNNIASHRERGTLCLR